MSTFLPNEDEILVVEVEKQRAINESSLEQYKDYGHIMKCWNNISENHVSTYRLTFFITLHYNC